MSHFGEEEEEEENAVHLAMPPLLEEDPWISLIQPALSECESLDSPGSALHFFYSL